jgi:hypothetical protein
MKIDTLVVGLSRRRNQRTQTDQIKPCWDLMIIQIRTETYVNKRLVVLQPFYVHSFTTKILQLFFSKL